MELGEELEQTNHASPGTNRVCSSNGVECAMSIDTVGIQA